MASDQSSASQNLEGMDRRQLEIYARELREHFREERRLRRELDDLNKVLEQRVGELEALNRMFQQHLVERTEMAEAFSKMASALEAVSQAGNALVDRVKAQPIPDA